MAEKETAIAELLHLCDTTCDQLIASIVEPLKGFSIEKAVVLMKDKGISTLIVDLGETLPSIGAYAGLHAYGIARTDDHGFLVRGK